MVYGAAQFFLYPVVRMKLDAASHLVRQPISFELFLLVYLVCALALQMINIYKTVCLAGLFVWCAFIRKYPFAVEFPLDRFQPGSLHCGHTESQDGMVYFTRAAIPLAEI